MGRGRSQTVSAPSSDLAAQIARASLHPQKTGVTRILSCQPSSKAKRELSELLYVPPEDAAREAYALGVDPSPEDQEFLEGFSPEERLMMVCLLAYRGHTPERDLLKEVSHALSQSDHLSFLLRGHLPVAILAISDDPHPPRRKLSDLKLGAVEIVESKDSHKRSALSLSRQVLEKGEWDALLFDAYTEQSSKAYQKWGLERVGQGDFGLGGYLMRR